MTFKEIGPRVSKEESFKGVNGRTYGRSYRRTLIEYYSVNFSAQNTQRDVEIPNKCLKFIGYLLWTLTE